MADENFREELRLILEKHRLPALAALMMLGEKVVVAAAAGERKLGVDVPVMDDDRWHIGSCTKSMTATIAAMLVQQGKLCWETTVGEIFHGRAVEISADWEPVTLEQLLTHRSGAARMPAADLMRAAYLNPETFAAGRRAEFVERLISRKLELPPGRKCVYSNQGYVVAGAMLECADGRSWEEMMKALLFQPLGMKSAGFGAPGTPGKIDAPWGHTIQLQPVPPGAVANYPVPLVMGPAGTVRCSLADLARHGAMHAAGGRKGAPFPDADNFVKLHTPPPGQGYAMGWMATPRRWAGGVALHHSGSNRLFTANVWIAPAKGAVFVAASNAGGEEAHKGTNAAINALIRGWLPERE